MHWPQWVRRRVGFWREALWRPMVGIVTLLYAAAGLPSFVRSVILPAFVADKEVLQAAQDRLTFAPRLPWYGWTLILLVVVLVLTLEGTYRAIRRHDTEAEKAQGRLRDQLLSQSPDLVGTIQQIIAGQPVNKVDVTGMHIDLSILNKGAPTIVHQWRAFATVGGLRLEAKLVHIADNTELTMGDGNTFYLQSKDAIYDKTTTRIETGAEAGGWLRIELDGVKPDAFGQPGNRVDVSYQDFRSKEYMATYVLGASTSSVRYFPGSGKLTQKP